MDFGDKNQVISAISNFTVLKFFEKFDNPFSHLVTCFLRVTVSMMCQSQGRTISSSFTINWNMYYDTACNDIATKP